MLGNGAFLAGPAAALAGGDADGVIVGHAPGKREFVADEVLGPASLGGDGDDVIRLPDWQC